MPVTTTLRAMAIGKCIDNIDLVRDFGDMTYATVEPILRCIKDPEQLIEIEKNSPHLAYHTADIWRALIRRDFPKYDKDPIEPSNPLSWWKIYRKFKAEADASMATALENLKDEMIAITSSKLDKRTTLLPNFVVPTSRARATRKASTPHSNKQSSDFAWSRFGSPTKNGASQPTSAAMQKVQKQAVHSRSVMGPTFRQSPSSAIRAPKSTQVGFPKHVAPLSTTSITRAERLPPRPQQKRKSRVDYGGKMLEQYVVNHKEEIDREREQQKELILSPMRSATTSKTPTPPKIASPIRRPRSSASPCITSSTTGTPGAKPLLSDSSIPELSLNTDVRASAASTADKASARKISLQEYSRKRKASHMGC